MDEQKLKINLTLITDVTPGDPTMEDEIFGPILPFVPVDSIDEAINLVNSKYVVMPRMVPLKRVPKSDQSYKVLISFYPYPHQLLLCRPSPIQLYPPPHPAVPPPHPAVPSSPSSCTLLPIQLYPPPHPAVPSSHPAVPPYLLTSLLCREKPLAFYVFTESKALFERIRRATSSGAILQNETLVHYQGWCFFFFSTEEGGGAGEV